MGIAVGLAVLLAGAWLHRQSDLAFGPWDGRLVGLVLAVVGALACTVALLWRWVDDPTDDPALHDRLLGH
ncbi:MAG: hypothetical protein M3P93_08760 [Actinomycetota bacterium]|nr:hypothetical protein [Actinomycetota bacterium]